MCGILATDGVPFSPTTHSHEDGYSKCCHCCDEELFPGVAYHCLVCDFWVDPRCARLPQPHDMKRPKAHAHPLAYVKTREELICHVCGLFSSRYHYECKRCDFQIHRECSDLLKEITHFAHPSHPLKLLMKDVALVDTDGKCCLCPSELWDRHCYRCSLYTFIVHVDCALNPPPLSCSSPTAHEHNLTLLPIRISFTCNACGMDGGQSPYVCLQCYFVVHKECVDLPRLIKINRHDHCISRTYSLDPEKPNPVCGVCRKTIKRWYGAYSCSICPQYVVHSSCATLEDVWDGKELYWKPEDVEDVEPFKVIADNVIEHFSHKKHHLMLTQDTNGCEATIRCKACIRPINSGPFYSCMQCDFFLHNKCANLPFKKRHDMRGEEFTLLLNHESHLNVWVCRLCKGISSSFKYTNNLIFEKSFIIDAQCSSIREPFEHGSHPHPLYCSSSENGKCVGCGRGNRYVLKRVEGGGCCEYALCYGCAGLPSTVKHKVDDHPLVLCYGEKREIGRNYWCDICEKEANPSRWFYTCNDCGLTLHVECVFGGDFAYLEPRTKLPSIFYPKYEVVTNEGSNRPLCCECKRRCIFSVILKTCDGTDRYLCSIKCSM